MVVPTRTREWRAHLWRSGRWIRYVLPAIAAIVRSSATALRARPRQRNIAIVGECPIGGIGPGDLLVQELDHFPLGKEALCTLGIGELERLEEEPLGLEGGNHNKKITTGAGRIES
jgi:hypothetical protein